MDVAESELQHKVVVVFEHVLDCKENCPHHVLHDVSAHLACGGNWHWVSVNHAETLLEDGALRLGGGDLLLPVVADGECLQVLVNDEAWL